MKDNMLRVVLIVFNSLDMITGGLLIGTGTVGYMMLKTFQIYYLSLICSIVIASGIGLLISSLIGCTGSIKRNKCLTIIFCVLTKCGLITIVATTVLFRCGSKNVNIGGIINNVLKEQIIMYNIDSINERKYNLMDSIQSKFSCCGIMDMDDWKWNQYFGTTYSIPDSCCIIYEDKGCGINQLKNYDTNIVNMRGCKDELDFFILGSIKHISFLALIVSLLMVFKLIIGIWFLKKISEKQSLKLNSNIYKVVPNFTSKADSNDIKYIQFQ